MSKKTFLSIVIIILIIAAGTFLLQDNKSKETKDISNLEGQSVNNETNDTDQMAETNEEEQVDDQVVEIDMESFTEVIDGEYFPQFSVKEIKVKKGQKVVLNITTTSGSHDIRIDEFDVHRDTPTGETTTIEFVANEAGSFVYYCHKPRHRELGQWGTLIVE